MCNKCFETEYYKFENEKINLEFEEKVTKLLSANSLIFLNKIKNQKNIYENYSEYECIFCRQIWCYSTADLYWRGFLIKKENIPKLFSSFKKEAKTRNIGFVILILVIVIVLIFSLTSCASSNNIEGKYKSNFADLGFFITTIKINNDETFEYNFSGDLVNQDLTGTYKVRDNSLYLKFTKEKFEIESKNDSLSITEILSGNYHNYELKSENGIQYHRKFKIGNKKLFNYRIDNGKLVNRIKKYSDRKRYIFFGPTSIMKRAFLQKVE